MMTGDVRYIGIPYMPHGAPPAGADCWTLCRYFLWQELGLRVPFYMYNMEAQTEEATALIAEHAFGQDWQLVTRKPCDFTAVRRGDVLIMTVAGYQQHCGICISELEFLHSLVGRNSTLERIARWASHIDAVIRWKRGKHE